MHGQTSARTRDEHVFPIGGRQLFTDAPGGWTLHQLRHSRLTHLAEAGVAPPLLMAESHASMKTLGLYATPSFKAGGGCDRTARLGENMSG